MAVKISWLCCVDKTCVGMNTHKKLSSYESTTNWGKAFLFITFFALKSRDLSFTVTPSHPRRGATLTGEKKNV